MSSLSSLYSNPAGHGLSGFPGLSSLSSAGGGGYGGGGGGGGGVPSSNSYFASETSRLLNPEPSRVYSSDPGPYGSSASYLSNMLTPPSSQNLQLSGWNPASSASIPWHQVTLQQLDPSLSGLKRPGDEVFYSGDVMSKRARVDSASSLPVYPQRPGEKDCAFYMRTRTCSYGASCKYDHPAWVPAGGIPDWKEASTPAAKSESLPVRSGEPDCAFYMKTGSCKYASKCKFNHPQDRSTAASDKKLSEEIAVVETVKGTSKSTPAVTIATDSTAAKAASAAANGDDGDANAPVKPATAFNAKGLPIRLGETDCAFYMKKGSCKYGSTCRFNHPDKKPATAGTQVHATVASILGGLSGSLGHPSAYSGALSDYGLSGPGSGFGISTLAQSSPYPQRPGESQCSYYMKTGICKFGAGCRFHHPMNRMDPSYTEPSVKLSLAGLPRREGEQSCSYYMKTGSCKFGTTCKFDHPPPGEAAAKALAEAGRSEQNLSSDSDKDELKVETRDGKDT